MKLNVLTEIKVNDKNIKLCSSKCPYLIHGFCGLLGQVVKLKENKAPFNRCIFCLAAEQDLNGIIYDATEKMCNTCDKI